MLTAAQVYYMTNVYPERVTDDEAQPDYRALLNSKGEEYGGYSSYYEAQAQVLTNLVERSPVNEISPAQAFYVCTCYPEHVSDAEVHNDFMDRCGLDPAEISRWQTVAQLVSELVNEPAPSMTPA